MAKFVNFEFDEKLCKACGNCYKLCPTKAIEGNDHNQPVFVSTEKCILCKMCELRCPDFAIRIEGER